jgi:simple sugar transport system substrate-binding protein
VQQMRRFLMAAVALALVAFATVASGCGSSGTEASTSGASAGKRLTFYSVIHSNIGDPFWAVYYKGAEDAAKQMNVEIKQLAPKEASIPQMVDLLNSALVAKPDGILTTIADAKALDSVLRRAVDEGIPVIALNVPDARPRSERIPYLTYVGGDERLGGQAAAEYMLRERQPTRAMCVLQNVAQSGLVSRCQGFTETMKDAGVAVDTLPTDNSDPTKIGEAVRSYLKSHKDTDAIFTLGPDPANAVTQILDEEGLADKVMHGSYDLSTSQTDAIKAGSLMFTIDQQQYLQTYLGTVLLAQNVRHGFVPASDVLTGPAVVDKSNVEEVVAGVEDKFR